MTFGVVFSEGSAHFFDSNFVASIFFFMDVNLNVV